MSLYSQSNHQILAQRSLSLIWQDICWVPQYCYDVNKHLWNTHRGPRNCGKPGDRKPSDIRLYSQGFYMPEEETEIQTGKY